MSTGAPREEQSVREGIFVRSRPDEDRRPPLVLVHGLGESGLCFDRLLAEPAIGGRRVLIPDLPGYGRSCRRDPPLDLAGHADAVAELIEALCTGPVTVVGHSMGGVVAQLLAENHPRLVAGLVDVDGNLSEGDCAFSRRAAGLDAGEFERSVFGELLESVHRGGIADVALRGYYVSLRLADVETFRANSLELFELSRGEGLAARLAALEPPRVYVAGTPDGAAPRSLELAAASGVPVIRVGPSGHWPFIDQPKKFAGELAAWLEREGL